MESVTESLLRIIENSPNDAFIKNCLSFLKVTDLQGAERELKSRLKKFSSHKQESACKLSNSNSPTNSTFKDGVGYQVLPVEVSDSNHHEDIFGTDINVQSVGQDYESQDISELALEDDINVQCSNEDLEYNYASLTDQDHTDYELDIPRFFEFLEDEDFITEEDYSWESLKCLKMEDLSFPSETEPSLHFSNPDCMNESFLLGDIIETEGNADVNLDISNFDVCDHTYEEISQISNNNDIVDATLLIPEFAESPRFYDLKEESVFEASNTAHSASNDILKLTEEHNLMTQSASSYESSIHKGEDDLKLLFEKVTTEVQKGEIYTLQGKCSTSDWSNRGNDPLQTHISLVEKENYSNFKDDDGSAISAHQSYFEDTFQTQISSDSVNTETNMLAYQQFLSEEGSSSDDSESAAGRKNFNKSFLLENGDLSMCGKNPFTSFDKNEEKETEPPLSSTASEVGSLLPFYTDNERGPDCTEITGSMQEKEPDFFFNQVDLKW